VLFAFLFVQARNREVAGMQEQLHSLEYLTPAHNLQQHVLLHGGLTYIVLFDTSYTPQLESDEANVDVDVASLQKLDARFGRDFGTTELVRSIREHWQEIKDKAAVFSVREMYDAHTRLHAQILDLIRIVGDRALVLDSSIDTYYLGNTLLQQIPGTAEELGQLRYEGTEVIFNATMNADARARLNTFIGALRRLSDPKTGTLPVGLSTALKANPRLEEKLRAQLASSVTATDSFVTATQTTFLGPKVTADIKDHFTMATGAIDNLFKLYDLTDEAYRAEVGGRIDDTNRSKYMQLGFALLALGAAVLLVWLITRGIHRQVGAMTNLFAAIGLGDFAARAEVVSQDELGLATTSLNTMLDTVLSLIQSREEKDKIQESIQKLLEEISGLAEGDLTKQAEVTAEVTGAIADAFNSMTDELRGVISRVQDTTQAVSSSAREVQTTTEDLANGSEAQATQIVEASAAIDEMAVSIQQVSGNAAMAASVAENALRSAKLGADSVVKTIEGMNGIRQQVQQTAKRIKRLGESSQEIGEIVQLINDIAERTSILALNASIQAAMAGDAGKGFAVVAEEVERLADHSTEATKKISTLIKSIQADTNEAITAMEETTREVISESGLANEAGLKLSEIEKISTQLSELIQAISLASKQQTRGSEGVAKSMADISQVTQQTAAGAKQAAISIRKLAQLADNLSGSLERFKLTSAA
jgi:twitching motility protein PilJ